MPHSKLNRNTLASMVDHTLLRVEATRAEITQICQETRDNGFASACLHPYWVGEMANAFPDIRLCTVIGFPLGMQTVKLYEAQKAVEAGAQELDIVVNHVWVQEMNWQKIDEELQSFRKIFDEITLKLIFETCRLSKDEITQLARLANDASFDWIKTSTGFAEGGATVEAVALMKEHSSGSTKVKASGGIRDLDKALAMIAAGAQRIGTSSGVSLMEEWTRRFPDR